MLPRGKYKTRTVELSLKIIIPDSITLKINVSARAKTDINDFSNGIDLA